MHPADAIARTVRQWVSPRRVALMHKPVYRTRHVAPVRTFVFAIVLVSSVAVLIPYASRINLGHQLPGALYGIGLWIVGFAAMIARWRLRLGILAATCAAGAGVPIAVLCKLVWDVVADPTSHNLWPFELAIALAVGAAAALVGALVGWVLAVLAPPEKA
jgi:hypothetical protein